MLWVAVDLINTPEAELIWKDSQWEITAPREEEEEEERQRTETAGWLCAEICPLDEKALVSQDQGVERLTWLDLAEKHGNTLPEEEEDGGWVVEEEKRLTEELEPEGFMWLCSQDWD